jgi:hypothetical protein
MQNEYKNVLPILTFDPSTPSDATAKAVLAPQEAPKRQKIGAAET